MNSNSCATQRNALGNAMGTLHSPAFHNHEDTASTATASLHCYRCLATRFCAYHNAANVRQVGDASGMCAPPVF